MVNRLLVHGVDDLIIPFLKLNMIITLDQLVALDNIFFLQCAWARSVTLAGSKVTSLELCKMDKSPRPFSRRELVTVRLAKGRIFV